MAALRLVRDIDRIPKVLEGGIRPNCRLVCVFVCEVYAEEQCRLSSSQQNLTIN